MSGWCNFQLSRMEEEGLIIDFTNRVYLSIIRACKYHRLQKYATMISASRIPSIVRIIVFSINNE